MSSAIKTPHLTGVCAILAFIVCFVVNVIHFYLSKTSKRRQTIFGKRLIFWSHGSMILMSLGPLFMIFSYFHIEKLFDSNLCFCRQWFAFAVIGFSTGLFLLKMNYLIRLNMVLNPGSTKVNSKMLLVYFAILACEMLTVDTIQYMVIDGSCNTHENFGCQASFAEWNGWMATGILFHDMALYYFFCVYYIRRVKAQLMGVNNSNLKQSSKKSAIQSRTGTSAANNMNNLQMSLQQVSYDTETSSQPSQKQIELKSGVTSKTGTSVGHSPTAGSHSPQSNNDNNNNNNNNNNNSEIIENSGNNGSVNDSSKEEESRRAIEREKKLKEKQREKLKLVYEGLIRQFRVTLLALGVCAFDLIINTIWMDYNMLFIFMFDCVAVVLFNFLGFRDSQHFVNQSFKWFKRAGCEACSILIDICCCMRDSTMNNDDDDDDTTMTTKTKQENDNDDDNNNNDNNNDFENDSTDDSYLRYNDIQVYDDNDENNDETEAA